MKYILSVVFVVALVLCFDWFLRIRRTEKEQDRKHPTGLVFPSGKDIWVNGRFYSYKEAIEEGIDISAGSISGIVAHKQKE